MGTVNKVSDPGLQGSKTPANVAGAIALVELDGVSKFRRTGVLARRVKTVDDLSCRFNKGAVTALLGHNGAGKTTTIRLILGLLRPTQGRILFAGRPMRREDRARIGYMPEVKKLPGELSCEEVLSHQLRLYGGRADTAAERRALIESRLVEVGLLEHRRKRVSQLSKGMARRLAWAQATIHDPEFLILDEPFSGLDPLARQEMHGWIAALRAKGTSMLLCTHEFGTVEDLCDDLFILNRGRVVYREDAASRLRIVRPTYLRLGDVDAPKIASLKKSASLPDWSALEIDGRALTLRFDRGAAAKAWLEAAVGKGLSVERFGLDPGHAQSRLMQYFKT